MTIKDGSAGMKPAGASRFHHRAVGLAGLLACPLVLLSACAIPSRPAWWPKHSASAGTASAGQQAVPTVTQPWHAGMRELGIQVYWVANTKDSDLVVQGKARRIINYAISLGANSIALTFPFYTYGIASDQVYASPATPSPAHIAIFLAEAARSRIRVTLRPILNEAVLVANNPNAWRGTIEPASTDAWFRSYRRLLMPYAEVAQAGHAATFVIGTELESLEPAPDWPGLISSIRSVYRGQLLYDENFDEFAAHYRGLPLSTFAVDAYPRFNLPDSTSVSRLARAWDGWLGTHSRAVLRKLVLEEVGITAVAGSYPDPGAWISTTKAPIDPSVQAKWYEAVCRAVKTKDLAGVYWWEVSFDADPANAAAWQSDRLTFLGRPAQDVIKNCFASITAELDAPSAAASTGT
jgi:hypothetical protein